jgi:hypothetical protein
LDGAEDKRRLGEAHAHAGGDGGHVAEEDDDGLSMTYRGNTHVFDSVPPHKVIDHGAARLLQMHGR